MSESTDSQIEGLIQIAREASEKAYAPYSKFRVGAALRSGQTVFAGCNVENASYGLTMCAERNAVAIAIAQGCNSFDVIAIYTDTDEPTAPCGACRQVLHEFSPKLRVIMSSHTRTVERTLDELLPLSFDLHPNR